MSGERDEECEGVLNIKKQERRGRNDRKENDEMVLGKHHYQS
jgi:hypothetical protein